MEKSIENIWTNSFVAEDKLSAPKLNKLYSQKSKSIIEKLKRTYEIDNKSLLPMAVIFGLIIGYNTTFLMGIYTFVSLIGLYLYNNTLLKELHTVDISSENYTYLVTYKKVIQKITKSSKRLVLYVIPTIVVVGFAIFAPNNKFMTDLLSETSIVTIAVTLISAFLGMGLLAFLSYYIGFKLVYANLLSKLDDLIADIEALNS